MQEPGTSLLRTKFWKGAYLSVLLVLHMTLETLLPSHGFILNKVEICIYDWIEFIHIHCSNWEEGLQIKGSLLCKEAYNKHSELPHACFCKLGDNLRNHWGLLRRCSNSVMCLSTCKRKCVGKLVTCNNDFFSVFQYLTTKYSSSCLYCLDNE